MNGQGDIIEAIVGIFVSIIIIWVFWQVLLQINIGFAVLFLFAAGLVVVFAILSILKR